VARAGNILNFSGSGVLGPVLAGTDPLGTNGKNFTFTGIIDESLSPSACPSGVAASVCYAIPAGDLSGQIGTAQPFTTTTPSTLALTIPGGTANDLLEVLFTGPVSSPIQAILELAPSSFNSGALSHPEPFTPSPQSLTAASSAPPTINGSSVSYCLLGLSCSTATTVLGISGTASTFTVGAVPEPGTIALLGIGLTGIVLYKRRKRTSVRTGG
jgi:hypothetical protein